MLTSEGEWVRLIILHPKGKHYEVWSTKRAASELNYSIAHTIRLCDEGKLIAHKIQGHWFVKKADVLMLRRD